MTNKYAKFIKVLRIERGFSQSFVADKLNLSRPSYASIESGSRGLTLEEAEKLKDLFGIPIEEFAKATLPKYEKYKQMILAYLQSPLSVDGKGRLQICKNHLFILFVFWQSCFCKFFNRNAE